MLSFLGVLAGRVASARRPAKASGPRYFRPCLEGFEDRVVPAAPVAPAALAAQAAPIVNNLINITGVQLTNLQVVNNVLQAAGTVTGTLAGLPFTANIANFTLQAIPDDPQTQQTECSVLHLELAPIHLSLLGLHVDTSAICLNITATEGGGILGDLLCGLAGGETGIPLIPTANQLSDLQTGLTSLLGGALNNALSAQGQSQGDSVCTGQCEVLDLSLGPVNLSLLGLNVSLDNCANGPVQVCVSATRGEGILGDLLCGLTGQGHGRFGLGLSDINQIVNTALGFLSDGSLSGRDGGQLTALVNHLKL